MAWEEEAANRWVTVDNAVPDVLPNPRAEDPNENCRETEEAAGVTWDGFKIMQNNSSNISSSSTDYHL